MHSYSAQPVICLRYKNINFSSTGTRTRVSWVKAKYPNQLDYRGVTMERESLRTIMNLARTSKFRTRSGDAKVKTCMGAVSLMVMIPAFQAGGPGSIPGRRTMFFCCWALRYFGQPTESPFGAPKLKTVPPPGLEPGSVG